MKKFSFILLITLGLINGLNGAASNPIAHSHDHYLVMNDTGFMHHLPHSTYESIPHRLKLLHFNLADSKTVQSFDADLVPSHYTLVGHADQEDVLEIYDLNHNKVSEIVLRDKASSNIPYSTGNPNENGWINISIEETSLGNIDQSDSHMPVYHILVSAEVKKV